MVLKSVDRMRAQRGCYEKAHDGVNVRLIIRFFNDRLLSWSVNKFS
jgi:hypothetical protein